MSFGIPAMGYSFLNYHMASLGAACTIGVALGYILLRVLINSRNVNRKQKAYSFNRNFSPLNVESARQKTDLKNGGDLPTKFTEDTIQPLPEFEWKTTEPRKYRPYKPKYNLTMSIETTTVSELIEMDKNYVERIMLRRRLMADNPEQVLGALDISKPAVDEFYTWLTGTYLPTRYPKMFQLRLNPESQKTELYSDVTGEYFLLTPKDSPQATLQILGGLVEDDLLFLMPADDGDGYQLKAFVTCFPNGFNMGKKLNLKLRDIHTPVPGYKEKLQISMDRWFDRLEVGKFVRRYNWTITPHDRLFTPSGNHLYEGQVAEKIEIDVDKTRVRSERQMVHRLPQSKAILFSFKTYLYPIREIKEEGLGEVLAEAIDGLGTGNVSGMYFYERAACWGESTKRYLLG